MAPSRNSQRMVLIEPTRTSVDNPSSLSAQLDREPAIPFQVPEIGDADSLEAITKDKPKKSTKYRRILGMKQQIEKKKTNEIPLLRPIFVSNTSPPVVENRDDDKYGHDKTNTTEKTRKQQNSSPSWQQQQENYYRQSDNSGHESSVNPSSSTNESGAIPPSPTGSVRRSKKYSSKLTLSIKHSLSSDSLSSDDATHENNPGRSNKYSATLSRHRERSISFDEKFPEKTLSGSSHARIPTTPTRANSRVRAGGSPSMAALTQNRQRSFSADDAPPGENHKATSSHVRLPTAAAITPTRAKSRKPRSPFANLSQRRQRSSSVDDKANKSGTPTTNNNSNSNRKSISFFPPRRQRSSSADSKKQSGKSASSHARLPTINTASPSKAKSGGRLPISPFASISRRRQRSLSVDDGKNKSEPNNSDKKSKLKNSNSSPAAHAKPPAKIQNRTPSSSSSSRNSRNKYIDRFSTGEPWKISPSGGLSLVSSGLQSSKNTTTGSSKKSKASSLASSLDEGASPDEIIAFGAVLDHIAKGGSLMNINHIFKKEVETRDQYRSEDPTEANYNKTKLHHGKLAPTFVKRKEYRNDESHEEEEGSTTSNDDDENNDDDNDKVGKIVGLIDHDYSSESDLHGRKDKYSTVVEADEGETLDEEQQKKERKEEIMKESDEESDWCVPHPPAHDDETAGTSTMIGTTGSFSMGLIGSIQAYPTPPSEDDSEENDDGSYSDSDYSSSESGSSCSETYESGSASDSESVSTDHSSSTLSTYRSEPIKKQRASTAEVTSKVKSKPKPKSSKKNKFLKLLQGKKTPPKKITFVPNENGDDTSNLDGDMSKVVKVDRLPDSFEDDNNENINRDNKLDLQGKKSSMAAKVVSSKYASDTLLKKSGVPNDCQDAIVGNKRKKKTKKSKKSKDRRKSAEDEGYVMADKIRALKQFVGMEEPEGKESTREDPPAMKFTTYGLAEKNTKLFDTTLDTLKQEESQQVNEAATIIKESKNETTNTKTKEENTTKTIDFDPVAVEETPIATKQSVILTLPEIFTKKDENKDGNDQEDGDTLSICGASLSLESIISLESLLEGDTPTFVKNVIDTASQITESIRSARSIFFPDDDTAGVGMTAADEFEKEMNMIEDPTDEYIAATDLGQTPKEIWVPEYTDNDAGREAKKQERGTIEYADCDVGLDIKTEESKPTDEEQPKKRNYFRKRLSFLQFKKDGGASTKRAEEDDIGDDESTESLEVDIFVYNRDKKLVGDCNHPHIYNGDKPLVDSTPSNDEDEDDSPKSLMASCNLMLAAKNAIQDTQTPSTANHLLELGMISCGGGLSSAYQMLPELKVSCISNEGQIVSSSENFDDKVGNSSKTRGEVVSSSKNGDTNEKWSDAIGTSIVDCGNYYIDEFMPRIEGSSGEKDQTTTEQKRGDTIRADTKRADTKRADTKRADTKRADTKRAETKKADTTRAGSKEGHSEKTSRGRSNKHRTGDHRANVKKNSSRGRRSRSRSRSNRKQSRRTMEI